MPRRDPWLLGRVTFLVTVLALGSWPIVTRDGAVAAAQAGDKIESALRQQLQAGGEATFLVLFKRRADLRAARSLAGWRARGQAVYDALEGVAASSQAAARDRLARRGIAYQPFFVANAIKVTAPLDVAEELAALPDVESVHEERVYRIPDKIPGKTQPRVNSVEWNIARINADAVWTQFGITGQGIVVANIDTGVDFTHQALVGNYRGNLGGSFDHDYNWWDPSFICGPPGSPPCDNDSHGTHTMGTAVGGDATGPLVDDIGVAPGARWMAAKGCESSSCSEGALLSSGQFMLAPTDLFGNDPDPSRRPHVVSNSWGGGGGDPFFRAIVQAWRAAGIFPVFANGNGNAFCGSVSSPGDYPESFGVGATNVADVIASFSLRGPSSFALVKPQVSAPGVDVRSSVPGNGYASFSGTSMATPHVAGLVALLWSGNPALVGDVDATAAAIQSSAVDLIDTSCGGDTDGDPNNVYGDGRIDALEACLHNCGPHGTLAGVVTDATTSLPLGGARLTAVRQDDGVTILGTSSPDGAFVMTLPIDPAPGPELFDVTASLFGYAPATAFGVGVLEDDTTIQDFALSAVPRVTVSGTVRVAATGEPVANATVRLLGTPLPPATTNAAGAYAIADVPLGLYQLEAASGVCLVSQVTPIVVDADETVDFDLAERTDVFGHRCRIVPFDWIDGDTFVPIGGDDVSVPVRIPFQFTFYGDPYGSPGGAFVNVSTNGFLSFTDASADYFNVPLPNPFFPNGAIYAFWDDLYVDFASAIKTATRGTFRDRRFVVEYDNVAFYSAPGRVTFEIVLFERDGSMLLQYLSMPGRGNGSSATVGIENRFGTDALQYSSDQPVIQDGLAVLFIPPPIDSDGDGLLNMDDNCPFVANPGQEDADGDLVGDVCDSCPADADSGQADSDGDTLGDVCDPCPFLSDCDADGYGDRLELDLGSDPLEERSTPETDDRTSGNVFGSCLDGLDNDLDGTRDFKASGTGDPGCDGDGNGHLDDPHQIALVRMRVARLFVTSATGTTGRVRKVRALLRHPLGSAADPARGLPAGHDELFLVSLGAAAVPPLAGCFAGLVDHPLTGEPEHQPVRQVLLPPGGKVRLTWLVQVTCPLGHEAMQARDALTLQMRVRDLAFPAGQLDMVRTQFGTVGVR